MCAREFNTATVAMCARESNTVTVLVEMFDITTVLQYAPESSILQQFCNVCLRVQYCDSFAICAQEFNTATVLICVLDSLML